ncbi:MAG TPA: hypothetical protein VF244_01335, partial [Acidimicrobiales bacterium]
AEMGMAIAGNDVVAVLPPVSGGSAPAAAPTAAPAPPPPVAAPPRPRAGPSDAPAAPPPPGDWWPPPISPDALIWVDPAGPTGLAGAPGSAPTGPGSLAAPPGSATRTLPVRPARRLRLVPPPPPDELGEEWLPSRDHPSGPTSMGRLALAPLPVPDPEPAAAPSPRLAPQPSPQPAAMPLPAPVGHQAVAAAVPDVAPAPVPEPRPKAPLAVVHHATRPHGRLGVAWAVVTTGLVVAGPGWLSAWMAVIAFAAASQAATVWRKRGERPLPAFAAATAAALPITAATGLDHMNMVVAGAIFLTLMARMATPTKAPGRDVGLTLIIGISVGMAAAAPVLLRSINISSALYLLACAAIYDAGAYLVGTGASSSWEGPAAGVVALLPLTMAAAVVLVPPFHGGSPLLLGALAAVLAPFGPVAGSALLGDRTAFAPALRRIDSLLIMGPIWAWCAAALLT